MPIAIERLQLGPMQNFVYLLVPIDGEQLAVVDPAWDAPAIVQAAAAHGRRVTDIVLTHHHFDHRNAVSQLLEHSDARIHVHQADWPELQALGWSGHKVLHADGDRLPLGPHATVQLIHTPGHTPGSQCVRVQPQLGPEALLTGDTLFVSGCGRCDLPGGNPGQMFDSLHRVLGALPGNIRVLPGHNYAPAKESTLDIERATNPYLQRADLDGFVQFRMRPRT